jgi:preprotein translocase subunit SecD
MLQIETWKRVIIWGMIALGIALALPNGFYTRVEQHNDALAAIEANGETPALAEQVAGWPSFLPSGLVNLGLDLRGGAHLLAEVRVQDAYETRIKALWPELRDALRPERATVGTIRLQPSAPDELHVRLSEPSGMDRAVEIARGLTRPVVSLSAAGERDYTVSSADGVLILKMSDAEKAATDDRTMQQSLEIIRNRIDEVGTREPTIQRQGSNRILIQVPGIGSAAELKELIGTTAQLTFQPVVRLTRDGGAAPGFGNEILPDLEDSEQFYVLETAPVVTGEDLVDAQPSFDQNGRPAVSFRFDANGARRFGNYTAENVGSPFAIVLDKEVISAPRINEAIPGGSGIITGNFSIEESTNLAVLLRAGALPAELDFLEERTIGPELGADSIEAGKLACFAAFALVLAFMWAAYGRMGIYANIALIINVGLIFGLLSLIGATLTLPGIAGIVLTIGMAVDANVLIFERIKEEARTSKGPARAIELGYDKALSAIIDANITTFITALILFVMGSGPVRGFAITLGLGILTSVFTAIFVTRLFVVMWFERRRPKRLEFKSVLRLVPEKTSWDFFKNLRLWAGISVLSLLIGLGANLTQGLNFGIDFQGGTSIRTQSTAAVDVGAYRDALAQLDLGDVVISEVFDPNFAEDQHVAMVRIQAQNDQEAVTTEVIEQAEQALRSIAPDIKFVSVESVGPKVSGELIWTAVEAVVLAIFAVLVYIWLRFEWQFAVGAVLALVHDVLLTIGVFSILQIRFDLAIIAALLTIVGYSLNDTVVVFDRVRENLRKYKTTPLSDVLNLSINETLSRTLMTSVTTLLALIALYVLGGDVIRGFVFAMIWGVLVGTYSSVFIASGVLHRLGVNREGLNLSNAEENDA